MNNETTESFIFSSIAIWSGFLAGLFANSVLFGAITSVAILGTSTVLYVYLNGVYSNGEIHYQNRRNELSYTLNAQATIGPRAVAQPAEKTTEKEKSEAKAASIVVAKEAPSPVIAPIEVPVELLEPQTRHSRKFD